MWLCLKHQRAQALTSVQAESYTAAVRGAQKWQQKGRYPVPSRHFLAGDEHIALFRKEQEQPYLNSSPCWLFSLSSYPEVLYFPSNHPKPFSPSDNQQL